MDNIEGKRINALTQALQVALSMKIPVDNIGFSEAQFITVQQLADAIGTNTSGYVPLIASPSILNYNITSNVLTGIPFVNKKANPLTPYFYSNSNEIPTLNESLSLDGIFIAKEVHAKSVNSNVILKNTSLFVSDTEDLSFVLSIGDVTDTTHKANTILLTSVTSNNPIEIGDALGKFNGNYISIDDNNNVIDINSTIVKFSKYDGNILLGLNANKELVAVNLPGGGITNIGLNMPNGFTVTPSTLNSNGTFAVTLNSQQPSLIFASPTVAAGVPTFRSLMATDIPALAYDNYESFFITVDTVTVNITGKNTGTYKGISFIAGDNIALGTQSTATGLNITIDVTGINIPTQLWTATGEVIHPTSNTATSKVSIGTTTSTTHRVYIDKGLYVTPPVAAHAINATGVTGQAAIYGENTQSNGFGIYGKSTSYYGVYGQSTTGTGLLASTGNGTAAELSVSTGSTAGINRVLLIQKSNSSAGLVGSGASISFELKNSVGLAEYGRQVVVLTDAVSSTSKSSMEWWVRTGNVITKQMELTHDGMIIVPKLRLTSLTANSNLALDSNKNIISTDNFETRVYQVDATSLKWIILEPASKYAYSIVSVAIQSLTGNGLGHFKINSTDYSNINISTTATEETNATYIGATLAIGDSYSFYVGVVLGSDIVIRLVLKRIALTN